MGERKDEHQTSKPPQDGVVEFGTAAVYEDVTSEVEPTIKISGEYEKPPAIVQPPGQYGGSYYYYIYDIY